MTEKISLLLISAGSLVGQNLVQAIGHRRHLLHLEATNSEASEPSLEDFDVVHIIPPTASDTSRLERLLHEQLNGLSCGLVIPCRDEDVLWLARQRDTHPSLSRHLLVGSAALAEVFLDKALSWRFSRDHHLPFVRTARLEDNAAVDALVASHPGPLIVKPCRGFASRGVWVLTDPDQLSGHSQTPGLVVQPYLGAHQGVSHYLSEAQLRGLPLFHSFEETKLSIQAFITPEADVSAVFVTLHEMVQGISRRVVKSSCPEARALGQRTAEAFAVAGWRGPLNIQCQRGVDGGYAIYEYNGRFTGATAARALLGFDELAIALQAFAGITLPPRTDRFAAAVKQPQTRGSGPLDLEEA